MSMICPNCGAENADENRICEKCGKRLSTERIPASSSRSAKKKKVPEFSFRFSADRSSKRKSGSSLKRNAGSYLKKKPGSLLNQQSDEVTEEKFGKSFQSSPTFSFGRSVKKSSILNRRGSNPDDFDDDFDGELNENYDDPIINAESRADTFEENDSVRLESKADSFEENDSVRRESKAGNFENINSENEDSSSRIMKKRDKNSADLLDEDSIDVDFDIDSDPELESDFYSDSNNKSINSQIGSNPDLEFGSNRDSNPDLGFDSNRDSNPDLDLDSEFDSDDSERSSSRKAGSSSRSRRYSKSTRTLTFSRGSRFSKPSRTLTFSKNSKFSSKDRRDASSELEENDGSGSRESRSTASLKERRAASMKRKRQKRIMQIRITVVLVSIALLCGIVFSIKRSINNYIAKREQMRYDELHATIDMVTLSPEEQELATKQKRMYEAAVDAASNKTGLSTEDEFDEFEAVETTAQLRTYLFGQQNAPDWKIYCSPTKRKTGLGTVAIKPEAQFKAGRLSYLYIAGALYYGQLNGEMYEPLFIDDLQIMLTGTTWTEEIETIVLEIPDLEDPDAPPEIEERENRHFDPTEDGEGDTDEAAIRLLAMLGGGDPSFGAAYVDQFTQSLGLMNTTMGSIGDLSDAYTTAKDLAVYNKKLFNNSILSNEVLVPLKELINKHQNVVGIGEKSCTLLFSDSTDEYEIISCILNPNGSPTALVLQVEGPGLKLNHETAASFRETILTELANRKE